MQSLIGICKYIFLLWPSKQVYSFAYCTLRHLEILRNKDKCIDSCSYCIAFVYTFVFQQEKQTFKEYNEQKKSI